MEFVKIKDINIYKSQSVDPSKSPEQIYEVYSVPSFDTKSPEYLRGAEIGSTKVKVKKHDVLLCKINPRINRVWVVGEPCEYPSIASSEWIIIRTENMNPHYLAWYFKSPRFQAMMTSEVTGIGGSLTRAQPKRVAEYPVPVASPDEQKHIIYVFESLQTVINNRRQQLTELDTLVKARFVEMFGDVIRNDKGWSQHLFSAIASSRLGKMLDAKQQTGKQKYPYLANFNVQWFRFELKNLNQMDFDEDDQVEFALQYGDLLVCEGGEIGRCAVWRNELQPCFFQKALHRVRCDKTVIQPDYLAWWFKYNCEHGGFSAIEGSKATIAHLPGAKLKNLIVSVPPIALQNEFVVFVQQTEKTKSVVRKALDEAQTLFDSLMQQHFG